MSLVCRGLSGLIHYSLSCPLQLNIFKNINYMYQIGCFLNQWICIEHWIWILIQWTVPIENNSKQTNNKLSSNLRANMKEPSRQSTNYCYHCSVTYIMQQWIHCYITDVTRQCLVPARMRADGNFSDARLERLHAVSIIVCLAPVALLTWSYSWCTRIRVFWN